MKDKFKFVSSIIMIIVFVVLLLWANIIDPILEKADEIGMASSIVRYVVLAFVIIVSFLSIGVVLHDDRIQEPYKSILGLGIFGLAALAAWYFRSHFGW